MTAPAVALETAVLTCGLPRHPWNDAHGPCPDVIDADTPINLAVVRAMVRAVRTGGARPIVTAVLGGRIVPGLDDAQLEALALDDTAGKASISTMSAHMAHGTSAGTTVSGTIRAAAVLGADAPRVMATGGIGGVHIGWPGTLDVSADLGELARRRTCIVCAGAKSIIDAHATAELLEALGVPMLALGTDRMPRFQSAGGPDDPEVTRIEDMTQAARIARSHWDLPDAGGVLVMCDPPASSAMLLEDVQAAAHAADAQITIRGDRRTPALLEAMATLTSGASLSANIDLLVANARRAAELATVLG